MQSAAWLLQRRFSPTLWQRPLRPCEKQLLSTIGFEHGSHENSRTNFAPLIAAVTLAASTAGASRMWCNCELDKEQKLVMAGDCGGTNTRLMLYAVDPSQPILDKKPAPGKLIMEVKYPNVLFKSLDKIIERFLKDECKCGTEHPLPSVCVLAVAGVVADNTVRYTNLDWVVNGYDLQKTLEIPRVEIINDFVAQGYGALTLNDDEVIRVNDATPVVGAPICCIGAGTGLGECFLVPDGKDYYCFPSEGGHVEFAPRGAGNDELQIKLLKHLKVKFSGWNRISVERVVSGKGICNVYEFLAYNFPQEVDPAVHAAFREDPENAGIIAKNNKPGTLCEKTMQMFASSYGSQVGALALHFMPFRGIYITGGVTQKSLDFLQRDGSFMEAYQDKGRVSPLLSRIPLYFVKSDDMGQRGAHYRAVQLLKRHLQGRDELRRHSQRISAEDLPPPREVDKSQENIWKALELFNKEEQKRLLEGF